jgi:CheY-like chemotaxis protein
MHWKRGLPGNWLHKLVKEAINSFDKNKFDICLLDIMMPVKDGFTVAKKIRQQSDVIPYPFYKHLRH